MVLHILVGLFLLRKKFDEHQNKSATGLNTNDAQGCLCSTIIELLMYSGIASHRLSMEVLMAHWILSCIIMMDIPLPR